MFFRRQNIFLNLFSFFFSNSMFLIDFDLIQGVQVWFSVNSMIVMLIVIVIVKFNLKEYQLNVSQLIGLFFSFTISREQSNTTYIHIHIACIAIHSYFHISHFHIFTFVINRSMALNLIYLFILCVLLCFVFLCLCCFALLWRLLIAFVVFHDHNHSNCVFATLLRIN